MVAIKVIAQPGCKVGSTFVPHGFMVTTDQVIADALVAAGLAVYVSGGRRKRA